MYVCVYACMCVCMYMHAFLYLLIAFVFVLCSGVMLQPYEQATYPWKNVYILPVVKGDTVILVCNATDTKHINNTVTIGYSKNKTTVCEFYQRRATCTRKQHVAGYQCICVDGRDRAENGEKLYYLVIKKVETYHGYDFRCSYKPVKGQGKLTSGYVRVKAVGKCTECVVIMNYLCKIIISSLSLRWQL